MPLDVKSLKLQETKQVTVVGKDLQSYDITLVVTKVDRGFIYTTYNRQGETNNVFVLDKSLIPQPNNTLKLHEPGEAIVIGRDLQSYEISLTVTKVEGGVVYTTYNRQGKSDNAFVPDVEVEVPVEPPTEEEIVGNVSVLTGVTGTYNIDLSTASYFHITLSGNTVFTLSGFIAEDNKTQAKSFKIIAPSQETYEFPAYVSALDGGEPDPTKTNFVTINFARIGSTLEGTAAYSTIE